MGSAEHGGTQGDAPQVADVRLADGTPVRIRPMLAGDRSRLLDAFARLSPDSRERRFFNASATLSPELVDFLTEVDQVDHVALAALALDEPGEPGVAAARYVRAAGQPDSAEVAITVIDDYQRRGLGGLLLRTLAAIAQQRGLRRFQGYVLADNQAGRAMLRAGGARLRVAGAGTLRFGIDLTQADHAAGLPDQLRALVAASADPTGGLRQG